MIQQQPLVARPPPASRPPHACPRSLPLPHPPAGVPARRLLLLGILALLLAQLSLLHAQGPLGILGGFLLAGLHVALVQSNFKAAISSSLPTNLHGTGFAVAALSGGLSVAIANVTAGLLCDRWGTSGAFMGGLYATSGALLAGILLL